MVIKIIAAYSSTDSLNVTYTWVKGTVPEKLNYCSGKISEQITSKTG